VGHVCCVAVGAWQAAALHVPRVVAPPALNFLLHGVCIDVAAASAMSAALPRCATAALRLYLLLCSVCDAPTHAWIRRSASRLMVKLWVEELTLVVDAVVESFTPACASLYSVPSQSNAKTQYLLSDADLARLRCVTKPNPQHKDWAPMRTYLVSQVRDQLT
jgi:XPA protein C-terminus